MARIWGRINAVCPITRTKASSRTRAARRCGTKIIDCLNVIGSLLTLIHSPLAKVSAKGKSVSIEKILYLDILFLKKMGPVGNDHL